MDSLNTAVTPAQYLYKFFNDYIERVFIGDYRELRTRDHPLSKSHQILRMVEQLDESSSERERLIAWYERKQFPGDLDKAERQYARDVRNRSRCSVSGSILGAERSLRTERHP